jgi:hypothetical protein
METLASVLLILVCIRRVSNQAENTAAYKPRFCNEILRPHVLQLHVMLYLSLAAFKDPTRAPADLVKPVAAFTQRVILASPPRFCLGTWATL